MAAGPDTYIYYEKHAEGSHLEGWNGQDMEIHPDAAKYVKAPNTNVLTRVLGYTFDGFVSCDEKGEAQTPPRAHLMVTQEHDICLTQLIKCFYRTATLNIGVLMAAAGSAKRYESQENLADKHHFFTFLLASARIVNIDVSRGGGGDRADIVNVSFNYQALQWIDHDRDGTLAETTWKDPTAERVGFEKEWNDRKGGKWSR